MSSGSHEVLTFSASMRPENVSLPHAVDFCSLPRPVQERFAAATRGAAHPTPLLFRAPPRGRVFRSLAWSVALTVVAVLLGRLGWGDVRSALAIHGPGMLAVDVLLVCGLTYAVVHAAALLRASGSMPYRAGTFLFPACLVEAHGRTLRVWPLGDALTIERIGGPSPGLLLRMRDSSRVFVPARTDDEAQRAEASLASLRPTLLRAHEGEDASVLAELDPLHDRALSNPFGPTERMKRVAPAWTRYDWALALGMGTALGLAAGTMRNTTSDASMFRSVAALASVPEYEQYLSHGGGHASEVRDHLLPMAELADAEARGDLDAIRACSHAHPSSTLQPQIHAALRGVSRARLAEAESVGTIGALDEFRRRHPDSGLDAEIAAARAAIYDRALEAWKARTHPDENMPAIVAGLLAWAETTEQPTLEIRFQLLPSRTLGAADRQAAASVHYPGPDALPSRHLTSDTLRGPEQRLALALAQAFARDFPPDLLSVRSGDRLPPDAPVPSAVPSLVITYAPEWAFTTEPADVPETIFAGLRFVFRATFVSPGALPVTLDSQTSHAPQAWKLDVRRGESRDDYEQRVYDAMVEDAFTRLRDELTSSSL